MRNIRELLFLG